MGNNLSAEDPVGADGTPAAVPGRTTGVTEARQANKPTKLPPGATKSSEGDWAYITVHVENRGVLLREAAFLFFAHTSL